MLALHDRELGQRAIIQAVLVPVALCEQAEGADRSAQSDRVLELAALRALLRVAPGGLGIRGDDEHRLAQAVADRRGGARNPADARGAAQAVQLHP